MKNSVIKTVGIITFVLLALSIVSAASYICNDGLCAEPGNFPIYHGVSVCGNGIIEPGEACDGTNFGGMSCGSLGFSGGTLSCSSSCQFVTSSCTSNGGTDGGNGGTGGTGGTGGGGGSGGSSTSSGGGSGGALVDIKSKIPLLQGDNDIQLDTLYSVVLDDEEMTIELKSIDNSSVEVLINGGKQTLNLGQGLMLDVDGDGEDDIVLTLVSIKSNGPVIVNYQPIRNFVKSGEDGMSPANLGGSSSEEGFLDNFRNFITGGVIGSISKRDSTFALLFIVNVIMIVVVLSLYFKIKRK
jgi:hypothetical protein